MEKLIEKLLCKHKWKVHCKNETTYQGFDGKRYIKQLRQTLICKNCGKITKIIL